MAHSDEGISTIFLDTFSNISDDLPTCDNTKGGQNIFHTVYFEKLTLIVKKEGTMYWYIPNRSEPLLTCTNSELKDVKYISFSGFDSRSTDVYYVDCPNA